METNCTMKVIVIIDGKISEQDRQRVLDVIKKNLKEYSFLGAQIDVELVG